MTQLHTTRRAAEVALLVGLALAVVGSSCTTTVENMTARQRYYAVSAFYLEVQTLVVANRQLIPQAAQQRVIEIDAAVTALRHAVRPVLDDQGQGDADVEGAEEGGRHVDGCSFDPLHEDLHS